MINVAYRRMGSGMSYIPIKIINLVGGRFTTRTGRIVEVKSISFHYIQPLIIFSFVGDSLNKSLSVENFIEMIPTLDIQDYKE